MDQQPETEDKTSEVTYEEYRAYVQQHQEFPNAAQLRAHRRQQQDNEPPAA